MLLRLIFLIFLLSPLTASKNKKIKFPYAKLGLTKDQAATHLLSRFTFGYNSESINNMKKNGLENWFIDQLKADNSNIVLFQKLGEFPDLNLSNREIIEKYPLNAQVMAVAIKAGYVSKGDLKNIEKTEERKKLRVFKDSLNLKNPQALKNMLLGQKIYRGLYSENQLEEVMTDFWFNHFNVSLSKNQSSQFILSYERDIIRPNALGKFNDLLIATAKSPAMLTYLDNVNSMSSKNKTGLNENYARELLELHTLGVDGGYTQNDVTEVARVFTGWTISPGLYFRKLNFTDKLSEDFMFANKKHDLLPKYILGKTYEQASLKEGEELIKNLSKNEATAYNISKKLAIRFVSDKPSEGLVNSLKSIYLKTDGNIKMILLELVKSEEFWLSKGLKTKTPFEYAISSLKVSNSEIKNPKGIINYLDKMSHKLYSYQAPTGYPDRASFWINSGGLLNRMNFGLALAENRINGVTYSIKDLLEDKDPDNVNSALNILIMKVFPADFESINKERLSPLITEKNISEKIYNMVKEESETIKNNNINELEKRVLGVLLGSPEFQKR